MPKNLANLLVEVYDTYPTALTVPRYADYRIKVSSRTVRRNHVGELIMSSGWTSLSASRGRVIVANFTVFLSLIFTDFPRHRRNSARFTRFAETEDIFHKAKRYFKFHAKSASRRSICHVEIHSRINQRNTASTIRLESSNIGSASRFKEENSEMQET